MEGANVQLKIHFHWIPQISSTSSQDQSMFLCHTSLEPLKVCGVMSSNHLETYRSDQVGVSYMTIAIETNKVGIH